MRRTLIVGIALALCASVVAPAMPAHGQVSAELVRDLETTSESSSPRDFTRVGRELWFGAFHPETGDEIYRIRSNGTTQLFGDIREGPDSLEPSNFAVRNDGVVFFAGTHDEYGRELWMSDGTPGGTKVVADTLAGEAPNQVTDLTFLGDRLFFVSAGDLWITDGTENGTRMITGKTAPRGLGAKELAVFKGKLFFQGDGDFGAELYVTDGTYKGTRLIKDSNVTFGAMPADFTRVGDLLFYTARFDDVRELWKTDGTRTGTKLVEEICRGTCYSNESPRGPRELTAMGGKLFFSADDGTHGFELWKSNGTEAGTKMLKNINPSNSWSKPSSLTRIRDRIYFSAARGADSNRELWRTDGTRIGTKLVEELRSGPTGSDPDYLSRYGDKLLFTALGDAGGGVWVSRGTARTTRPVQSGGPRTRVVLRSGFTSFQKKAFFVGERGSGIDIEPWVTDATNSGTHRYANVNGATQGASIGSKVVLDDTLYFPAGVGDLWKRNTELYKSDGTEEGTVLVKEIRAGLQGSDPEDLLVSNGLLFFTANDGTNGRELWRSDGTPEGTFRLTSSEPPPDEPTNASYELETGPHWMIEYQNNLYFGMWDGTSGGLHKTDGTVEGTELIENLSTSGVPSSFEIVNGAMYFVAHNELWKSNGTADGTTLVKEFDFADQSYAWAGWLTNLNGTLMLSAYDFANGGHELWKSDGTQDGTILVKDIRPVEWSAGLPNSSEPYNLTVIDGLLYFAAIDEDRGNELWQSDGTQEGTSIVEDINPSGHSFPEQLTAFDGDVVFVATSSAVGRELFRLDLDSGNVELVKDLASGPGSGRPWYLTVAGPSIYFSAQNAQVGPALWESDGTEDGTQMVLDLSPGTGEDSGPRNLQMMGGQLYFDASDVMHGHELRRMSLP